MKICKVEGCENTVHARGYCDKHYVSFMKYGDPTYKKQPRHGMRYTTEYRRWGNIIQACRNPNSLQYPNHGGKGILVCERWRGSFPDFLTDMGAMPEGAKHLTRIDASEHYTKENCRWT